MVVRNSAREIHHFFEVHARDPPTQFREARAASHTGEMHVCAAACLDMSGYFKQDVESILNAHGAHVADEKSPSIFQVFIGSHWSEGLQVRSVTHNKHVFGVPAAAGESKIAV